jgi:hypothetical protein
MFFENKICLVNRIIFSFRITMDWCVHPEEQKIIFPCLLLEKKKPNRKLHFFFFLLKTNNSKFSLNKIYKYNIQNHLIYLIVRIVKQQKMNDLLLRGMRANFSLIYISSTSHVILVYSILLLFFYLLIISMMIVLFFFLFFLLYCFSLVTYSFLFILKNLVACFLHLALTH